MNPIQIVELARPPIGPMSVDERRQLREQLFDAAMRSQPAPTGPEVNSTYARRANALRLGALVLLGAIAVAGLAFSASRSPTETTDVDLTEPIDVPATTVPERATVAQAPRPTTAPSTTVAAVAGTPEAPLLLPPERSRLEDLSVTRAQLGASTLFLRAPDLTTFSLREADGVAPTTTAPPIPVEPIAGEPAEPPITAAPGRRVGAMEVTQVGLPGTYDVALPCGTLQVRESALNLPFRPELTQLLNSMSMTDGVIDIQLPAGWVVIDMTASSDEFVLGIPLDVAGRNVTITLRQYPDAGVAAAGFSEKQFEPIAFRGAQAWISRNLDEPGQFEIIGTIGTTAFSVEADNLALVELEAIVDSFVPGTVDEWIGRFGALPVEQDPDIRTCLDQPSFIVTQR